MKVYWKGTFKQEIISVQIYFYFKNIHSFIHPFICARLGKEPFVTSLPT